MTWKQFTDRVNASIELMGVTPEEVEVEHIEILLGESISSVDIKRDDYRQLHMRIW